MTKNNYKISDDSLVQANCNTNTEITTVNYKNDYTHIDKFEYEKKINELQSLVDNLRKMGGI